jgi:hypothetical protein
LQHRRERLESGLAPIAAARIATIDDKVAHGRACDMATRTDQH